MQTIVNGVKVNYEYEKRSDLTIVFLHGWGGGLNSFKGVFNYFFSNSNYSLLNIDLPPFGNSAEPPKTFTIYDYYLLVLSLIKRLNIKSIEVVGHSFGARIAMLLASLQQGLVKSATLIGAAGIKPKKSLKTKFKILNYKIKKRFVKNKEKLQHMGSNDYKALNSNMKKVFINIVNEDLTKYLKHIKCKTLIFWAKDDKETPLYMAKKLNKKIKNSGLVLWKTGGHFCYLTHHNQFVKALKYFINN